MRVRSAKEVFATMRGNNLRSFPGRVKGKERLRPFAQPQMLPGANLPSLPVCHSMGTCLARAIDKAIVFAGLPILAAQNGLTRRYAAFNPPTTFHKPNLPSIENELRWAADPTQDAGVHSLAELRGEFVDMQINAQFANDLPQASNLRRAYNESFAKVFESDLIFLTIGMAENWFDTKTRLYVNGFPPRQLETAEPGRFEMHDWQVEDVKACLQRIYDLIQENTRQAVPPRLVVCVSPIGIVFGHGPDDQLIADVENKAIMRVAAAEFAREHEHADYGPIYEFAVLSDRSTVYETGLIDHINISCVDRFLGEYLIKNGCDEAIADRLVARGLANTHMIIKQYDEAAEALDEYSTKHGTYAGFASLHARALQSAGRKEDALHAYINHAEQGGKGAATSAGVAVSLALSSGRFDIVERMIALARASDEPEFAERADDWTARLGDAQRSLSNKANEQERVADLLERMMIDPQAVVKELESEYGNPATPERLSWIYAQALMKTNDQRAAETLKEMIINNRAYGKQAGNRLMSIIRRAGGNLDGLDEAAVRKLLVERQLAELGGR